MCCARRARVVRVAVTFRASRRLRMLSGRPHAIRPMSQRLCLLSDLPEGQPVAFEARVEGSEESLLMVRRGEGAEGFLNVCPHAGRRLDWAPGKFLMEGGRLICAAHGASFELPGGRCVAGPCKGQALRPVALRINAGEAWLADA